MSFDQQMVDAAINLANNAYSKAAPFSNSSRDSSNYKLFMAYREFAYAVKQAAIDFERATA